MKKMLFPFLFSLFTSYISAQVSVKTFDNIDSAIQELKSKPEDSSRVKLLQGFFNYYSEYKLDSALYYTEELLRISQQLNYTWGIGRGYGNISHINIGLGNFNTALEYGLKCLRIFENLNYPEELSISYNRLGRIAREQNNLQEALNYFRKATEIDEFIPDAAFKALHYTNISTIFLRMNMPDSALAYAETAYRLWRNAVNKDYMSLSMGIISEVHSQIGNQALAIEYCRLGIRQSAEVNNLHSTAQLFFKLAKVYLKAGHHDSSQHYAKKSLHLYQQLKIKQGMHEVAMLLADTFKERKQIDSAYKYQSLVLAIKEEQSSEEKINQIQNLNFEEKLRQQEIIQASQKEAEARKVNLQYSVIALGLVSFIIFFLLISHSVIANQQLIRFLGILALLIVFEFINLLAHPFLDKITNHAPVMMLAIMVCIAALLIPLHHRLEKWVTNRLIEKNKKIRLKAARKTIEKLESKDN